MSNLKLTRFLSNGCILQREKPIHIWGWLDKESDVRVELNGASVTVIPVKKKHNYRFDCMLDPMPAGGPYTLTVETTDGEKTCVTDVYLGDVFQLAGQSNIEFPMIRVKDTYPEEFAHPDHPLIREFKIVERREFHTELEEVETGSWVSASADSLPNFSVIGFFLAKHLQARTGVAVGLVNTSLGGAPIESFLSRDMLKGREDILAVADQYADDSFVESQLKQNEHNMVSWMEEMNRKDAGVAGKWEQPGLDLSDWKDLEVPCLFKDVPDLKGFIGSVWLKTTFTASEALTLEDAMLWLGVLVDADVTYINGVEVGTTPYCYPPRRYPVPKGILKPGENELTIRLRIERGLGRITPGKLLALFNGEGKRHTDGFNESIEGVTNLVKLGTTWKYKVGCTMEHIGPTDFISWKPTALWNGMVKPCTNFPVKALIWYQGESNAGRSAEYQDLMRRMLEGYRKLWQDETMPCAFVELPAFNDVLYEPAEDYSFRTDWSDMQKVQARCLEIPYTMMVSAEGCGEENDLHPQVKEPLGERLAALFA